MLRSPFMTALLLLAEPACAQDIVRGDATAGLVSRSAQSDVHLFADPALNARRLVLKLVVLNRSGNPQPFGPDAITVASGAARISLVSRETLIAEQTGTASPADETAQAHASASMPVNGAGQADVSGFTGSMNATTMGVPTSSFDRARRRPAADAAGALDATLLKPITIAPNRADGGQVVTQPLKHRPSEVIVAVTFAGDVHQFAVPVPR